MPPAIVYDGVNGPYEGTLFNGLKFFVSKRLPLRSEAVANIKNNGGKTVELEKFADVLIWDNLITRGAPPGAVSVKFIEECVNKGEIVNKEEYLVTTNTRPVGSSASTRKGTKNSFTPQDDQILFNWVRQKAEAGAKVKGLAIYRELAEKYPHHTYQSWQARYIDRLSLLPQNSVRPPPPPAPTPVQPRSSATNARVAPSSTSPNGASAAAPRVAPSSTAPVATPTSSSNTSKAPSRRVPFSDGDDEILIRYVSERGGAKSGNKIYKELEEQYPHHTWQSWRDRWLKTLSKRRNSAPSEIPGTEPKPATRRRQEPSASELPPAKRPRTSISSSSAVQPTAAVAAPSTQRILSEEEKKAKVEALKEKKRKLMEEKAASQAMPSTQAKTSGQAKVSSQAVSSTHVEEPGNEVRHTSTVSSTPLASGSRKDDLKRKMEQIRAGMAQKAASTLASTPQLESFRRTSTISNGEQDPQPQLQQKKKGKEAPTPTPATNETPGFLTQVSMPGIDSPDFQTQATNLPAETPPNWAQPAGIAAHEAARKKQLGQARARSRENMAGLITSRESWLGLRRVFHEFNQHPEPSETMTVFGREVDGWDLWSGMVREGYPPCPDAWVRIAEGLGFVDDRDLLEEGQRSAVQALREAFEEHLVEFWLTMEWFAGVKFEPVEVEEEEGED